MLNPSISQLFYLESFKNAWQQHLAPQFKVQVLPHSHWMIYPKPLALKGKICVKQLSPLGWNTSWCQDEELAALQTLDLSGYAWDYLQVHHLQADVEAYYPEALQPFKSQTVHFSDNYVANLALGYDDYLKQLPRKKRQNILRTQKNAQGLAPFIHSYESDAEFNTFFELFFPLHQAYWTQKTGHSYFNLPGERAFIVEWARQLKAANQLWLAGLMLNNTLASLSLNVQLGNHLYGVLTINTGEFKFYYPGLLSYYYLMQQAVERGVHQFYFGSGNDRFKNSVSSYKLPTYATIMSNPKSIVGRCYTPFLIRSIQAFQANLLG